MNLVIDIGNTLTKVAVFSDNKIIFNKNYETLTVADVQTVLKDFNIVCSMMSNVKNDQLELEHLLMKETRFFSLNEHILLPFVNLYSTPNTLGKDRIALVAAAATLFSKTDVLVIDAGTCITYDFIDKNNNYLGGSIAPGVNLRLKSLNQNTGKLPLVDFSENEQPKLIGDSTVNSIKSGVFYGVKFEIERVIDEYTERYENLQTVITGGNAEMFDLESKNRIFADKFFLLKGLNEILKYNAKN
ncbi:MAG: type III pantothenate kinase [Bacteroidetes bacterium]|nr:type III pantothenate kinase [Bacteroidota bacterium]